MRCSATRTFSSTVRCGNTAEIWNERMTPRRAICAGFSLRDVVRRRRRSCPRVGVRNLVSRLKQVVLPAPLGPISAWMVPRRTCRLTLSTATKPLNSLVSSRVSRMMSPLRRAPLMPRASCEPPRRPGVAAEPARQVGARRRAPRRDGGSPRSLPSCALLMQTAIAGDRLAGGVEDRRAERVHAFAHAFVVDAVAALARQRQLLEQRLDVARALAGEARAEAGGEAAPHLVGRQPGEHRLAAARQIRRQAHADVERQAERPGAVAHADVERVGAGEHREDDRFLGRDAAVGPQRVELLGDVGAGDEGLGQAHHARADQERAVGLAAQVAERDQRVAQAVDAALGQRQLAGQPRQASSARAPRPAGRAASARATPPARAASTGALPASAGLRRVSKVVGAGVHRAEAVQRD